ncbi:MAG TPA: HAMP domain-containing sensor histidine kinase [bacterium]|nr:HAMP domain-containing sensor histidine kinase [bacterium]
MRPKARAQKRPSPEALAFQDAARLHEIRNHLTALSVSAQMFPRKKDDPVFLGSFEKLLTRETDRLLELVRCFMDRTRPELEPKVPVDWGCLMERVLGLMAPVFQEKGTKLETGPLPALRIKGRECQLESLALNLVRNALESAGRGGTVRISNRREGRSLEFQVWNDGPSIPRELWEEIFKPYFSTKRDGTGMGLAICRWVVRNHGGDLRVESSAAGTSFRARLPLGVGRKPKGKGRK